MNLLEIHSRKADNGVASLHGFGCGDYNPGDDWRRYRGLLFHASSILDPVKRVNKKTLAFS